MDIGQRKRDNRSEQEQRVDEDIYIGLQMKQREMEEKNEEMKREIEEKDGFIQ